MSGRRPGGCLRLFHAHRQPELTCRVRLCDVRQGDALTTLRRDIQRDLPGGNWVAIQSEGPVQDLVVAMAEQIFAGDLNLTLRARQQRELEKLLCVLRLKQRRMRRAVGKHQPVHTELAIVRRVAKVAAVRGPGVAFVIVFNQRLIDPVPDEAALQARVLAERLPVFGESAEAVTHRVGIFAEDQRALFAGQRQPFFD